MDHHKSDDDSVSYNNGVTNHDTALPLSAAAVVGDSNSNVYAELVHAGFRPPQSFVPDRARKRRRSRFEVYSSDEDDDGSENTNVGARALPRRIISLVNDDNNDDNIYSDQDTKPRAIEKSSAALSNAPARNVTQNRLQQPITATRTTRIKTKNKGRSRKHPLSTTEQELPLQLVHRLIEPIGGRRKRKRINKDSKDKDSKITTEQLKRKSKISCSTTKKVNSNIDQNQSDDNNNNSHGNRPKPPPPIVTTTTTPLVVAELPPFAIIRGSITHKILQKLNRLDMKQVHDDPYQPITSRDGRNNDTIANALPMATSEHVPINGQRQQQTAMNAAETSSSDIGNSSNEVETMGNSFTPNASVVGVVAAAAAAEVSESVCMRATVIPQRSVRKYPVVILQGPHKGRTGHIVDEIDGQYSVIESDDPDDINKPVKWMVHNMLLSAVAEFMEQQQQVLPMTNPPTAPILETEQVALVATTTTTGRRPRQSKHEIFLTCLWGEMALNGHKSNT